MKKQDTETLTSPEAHRNAETTFWVTASAQPPGTAQTPEPRPSPELPAPPEGFTVYGYGPLPEMPTMPSPDIAGIITPDGTWVVGCFGNVPEAVYALRTGSPLATLNGLNPGISESSVASGIPESSEPSGIPESSETPNPTTGIPETPQPGAAETPSPGPGQPDWQELHPTEPHITLPHARGVGHEIAQSLGQPTEPHLPATRTVREWLDTLPEDYRELALDAVKPSVADDLCPSLEEALSTGLTWVNSREGWFFWRQVHAWAVDYEELPPIPPLKTTVTVPRPPAGFVFLGLGPLKHTAPPGEERDLAILAASSGKWFIGVAGRLHSFYAARRGSRVAELNNAANTTTNA